MKINLKTLLLIIPSILLCSCSNQNYAYEGNVIQLEKPLSIEIFLNGQGAVFLKGEDLNSFYDKYFKNMKFLETSGMIYGYNNINFWYTDRDIALSVGCTEYGLPFINDLENKKYYGGLESIDYNNFEKDLNYYFDNGIAE